MLFYKRASDRLLHMDEMDQENLDGYLTSRGRSRRKLLRASSFMGVLAANRALVQQTGLRRAEKMPARKPPAPSTQKKDEGKVHVVEFNQ